MNRFIDLNRQFRDLTQTELKNSEFLASLSGQDYGAVGWADILKLKRVIILAEEGSGKSFEMKEQVRLLREVGHAAFFVPLNFLNRDKLPDALPPDEKKEFSDWHAAPHSSAWLFLDAADELKLVGGDLDHALMRLSHELDGNLHRVNIVISCRPNDWRPDYDLNLFKARLPIPDENRLVATDPVKRFVDQTREETRTDFNPILDITPHVTALLPLTEEQVATYIKNVRVTDPDGLIDEIEREDAWIFTNRPTDVEDVIAIWNRDGRLGSRVQQHEANIAIKLSDKPGRPDGDLLTEDDARIGSERIALAQTLMRTTTIRSPDHSSEMSLDDNYLDPTKLITDWTSDKRSALLRRALFDPATYGRLRIHHRSVQEFLAARHLRFLIGKGMSEKSAATILFSDRYGFEVVRPSMQAIAAWLSLWNDDVCKELTRREPEALLSLGDPSSLSPDARDRLVRSFVDRYRAGGRRGLSIPPRQLRRLVHPNMADTVRELWGDGTISSDVRSLLLGIMSQGAMNECADLAEQAARRQNWEVRHRVAAISALLAMKCETTIRSIAQAMINDSAAWPIEIAYNVVADLFPGVISVDDLIQLIQRPIPSNGIVTGFEYELRKIADSIHPLSDEAMELRDKLGNLILRHFTGGTDYHDHSSLYGHLSPALASLCTRQLNLGGKPDAGLLRACAIAAQFRDEPVVNRNPVGVMVKELERYPEMRSNTFWAEVEILDEILPTDDEWHRYERTARRGSIGRVSELDRPWLQRDLADTTNAARRPVALSILLRIWEWGQRPLSDLETIQAAIGDDIELEAILTAQLSVPAYRPEIQYEKREKIRQAKALLDAKAEDDAWRAFFNKLIADPDGMLSGSEQQRTLRNLYEWLRRRAEPRNRLDVWDTEALKHSLGPEITDRIATAMQEVWRKSVPVLWSARPVKERDQTKYDWIIGLCGLSSESSVQGWEKKLSASEARTAIIYATVELNGFSSFLPVLVNSHPSTAEIVLGDELDAELAGGGEQSYLPILQNTSYADITVKRCLKDRLFSAILGPVTTGPGTHWPHNIDQMVQILAVTSSDDERKAIAAVSLERYQADPTGQCALTWLRSLFRFDPNQAAEVIIKAAESASDPDSQKQATIILGTVFGDFGVATFDISDPATKVKALARLVRCAYVLIRPDDDLRRDGQSAPEERERAERAREFLLATLVETPGPEANTAIIALADAPEYQYLPDRLKLVARKRAATDSEFPAYDYGAVAALESRHELPPRTRDELFAVMMDRLRDLQHLFSDHDFSDRKVLRGIDQEVDMQKTLAWRIEGMANGAYTVTRENETADGKMNDIQLSAVIGLQKAAIEIKLADKNWTIDDLVRCLRAQIVGQYLRYTDRRAGCLLLPYGGAKKWWMHPFSRKRLTFEETVNYLKDEANAIEVEQHYAIKLAVFGLDLRDPHLAPAHR